MIVARLGQFDYNSVTPAHFSTVGTRILRGPLVPILSVAGFLLVWFIAAEIAQGGGTATEREGPWGTELRVVLKVTTPDDLAEARRRC